MSAAEQTSPIHQRVFDAMRTVAPELTPPVLDALAAIPASQPNGLAGVAAVHLRGLAGPVVVTGSLDRRLLAIRDLEDEARWLLADLTGPELGARPWPAWAAGAIRLSEPYQWMSWAQLTPAAVRRLLRPVVLVAALYRPEVFPLPRFPLGISDLARAARETLTGRVDLMDMQLGATVADIVGRVSVDRPDILGLSATFGQHDLLTEILDDIGSRPVRPLVVAGGSLTARNERLLLERYPWLLVARGAGEDTMQDLLDHWHGVLDLEKVRGLGYLGTQADPTAAPRFRRTAGTPNRLRADVQPELDLLDETLARHGVAQLESARGCTNFCSFCPRGHKGSWAGSSADRLRPTLAAMGEAFDRHPATSRTVYLVDEEFLGREEDAEDRATAVATALHDHSFRWETSCRVDQVVRANATRSWHLQRAEFWRAMVDAGLRRCLFGVESGVDSILVRFAKETTAEQNVLAVRTLTALGVPVRLTYITFDQLMTMNELQESLSFQLREDVLLRPLPHLTSEEIVYGARDPAFVAQHSVGVGFYTAVSYLLVSMECLIGAPYTRRVQAAGLAGAPEPAMGRVGAAFADWRIGRCAAHSQLWVDRNFALDYSLKSLEKVLDGEPRRRVRDARVVVKDAAVHVLADMVAAAAGMDRDAEESACSALDGSLLAILDRRRSDLATTLSDTVSSLAPDLSAEHAELLVTEHDRWRRSIGWSLINAVAACETG